MPIQPSPIKKIVLALSLILVTGGYVVWARVTSPQSTVSTTPATPSPTPTPVTVTPAPVGDDDSDSDEGPFVPTTNPTPAPVPPVPVTGLKNGTYTGTTANTVYGPVQVKAVITGGKLAAVQILQFPNHNDESIQKSNHAMPILTQEAIVAQSAQVNTVSGATETSQGFTESLTSALALAK